MDDLTRKLELALQEIERLKQENQQLKQKLGVLTKDNFEAEGSSHSVILHTPTQRSEPAAKTEFLKGPVHNYSTPNEKIKLFRSLFRGREDVYPNRWESKTGRSGYSPACQNEWSLMCKKPQVKCSDCAHRAFLPVTDGTISNHLDAKINRTIGVYPMLQDETCWFIAMDFDNRPDPDPD